MPVEQPSLSEEELAELERLLVQCGPQNIDTAEVKEDDDYNCPLCAGNGEVEGRTYLNHDAAANGIQFFGVGDSFRDAEALFRKTIAALPALLAMARRSVPGDARAKRCLTAINGATTPCPHSTSARNAPLKQSAHSRWATDEIRD